MSALPRSSPDATGGLTVVGIFARPRHVGNTLRDMQRAGVTMDQVMVLTHDGIALPGAERGCKITGALMGTVLGAIVGALLGWLAGLGSPLALPVWAPAVLADALLAVAGGAALGALAGGVTGVLARLLIAFSNQQEVATLSDPDVVPGDIVIMADVGSAAQAAKVEAILRRYGGTAVATCQTPPNTV